MPRSLHDLRSIRRLRLAESDMQQAEAAAICLEEVGQMNAGAARALETGLVVCYARPFVRSRLGKIPEKLARPEDAGDKALHAALIRHRHTLYAHNDETELRTVEDTAALLGVGEGRYGEAWHPLDRRKLVAIAELCRKQAAKFRGAADDIQSASADDDGRRSEMNFDHPS